MADDDTTIDERAVTAAVAALPAGLVRARTVVELPATADWLDTGIHCAAGDAVTLVAAGQVWLAESLGIGFAPRTALWYRVGEGPIAKALADTTSFVAARAGRLHVVAKPPGEWLDEAGRFDPAQPRDGATGGLTVGAVVWRDDAALAAAATRVGGPFARERERQAGWIEPPPDWRPLWRLGHGAIYRAGTSGGRPIIACRTQHDAGILRRAVDVALDESTRLQWAWCVRRLPSAQPEDALPTHDYLSIAVEFEDGRDLTYVWSNGLPVGSSFGCPLPWWCDRETHLVVRSGPDQLGVWHDEERAPLADHRAAIGGPAPRRIVAVWLIAVSLFQRGVGDCDWAAIALTGSGGAVTLL